MIVLSTVFSTMALAFCGHLIVNIPSVLNWGRANLLPSSDHLFERCPNPLVQPIAYGQKDQRQAGFIRIANS